MEPSIKGCLVKLTGNTSERRIQLGAEAIHDGDDGNGDAGSDQAILNGRGAGLVLRKTRNMTLVWKGRPQSPDRGLPLPIRGSDENRNDGCV